MTTYAMLRDNVAREVVSDEAYATFNDTVKALFAACPDGTAVHTTFTAPATWTPPAPIVPPAPLLPLLTPMQFYLAFTVDEMIAIKGSVDPKVKEFYARYQLAFDSGTPIDPNLISVQGGLDYLATATTATPPGPGILAAGRAAQISAGVPQ